MFSYFAHIVLTIPHQLFTMIPLNVESVIIDDIFVIPENITDMSTIMKNVNPFQFLFNLFQR